MRAGQVGVLAGLGVFTTLRAVDGALFAWERHWARLTRDARLIDLAMPPDRDALESDIRNLLAANGAPSCTVRLVLVRNSGSPWVSPDPQGKATDVLAMTADSNQWGASVRLGLQPNARFAANEFCGAKLLSWAQNLTWADRAHRAGLDEVVLLNERGQVAECTSANIFAVFGRSVLTPPLADGCLSGITREVLLEIGASGGFEVSERSLTPDDLYAADEVFITSTTRGLLPVAEFAGRALNRNSAAREKLAASFSDFVMNDISSRRPAGVRG